MGRDISVGAVGSSADPSRVATENRRELEVLARAGVKRILGLEYHPETTAAAGRSERHRTEHELKQVEKKLAAILAAIEQSVVTETTRTRLLELEREKSTLERRLSEPEAVPYPSLHPNLVNLYRREVGALEEALNDPGIRLEASEILRPLIDKIVVTPRKLHGAPCPSGEQLQEELA